MTLALGTRPGPDVIVAPLGAGGMGEVYRARDTRLERTVTVLPQHLSTQPDVRARLEREARAENTYRDYAHDRVHDRFLFTRPPLGSNERREIALSPGWTSRLARQMHERKTAK